MAALTADRLLVGKGIIRRDLPFKVKTGVVIYKGALVAVDTNGWAVPAVNAAATKVVGVCREQVDNTDGANGDLEVRAATGVFKFVNDTGTPVAQTSIGDIAYVVDDQTVSSATGANSTIAGLIVGLDDDDDSVWVDVGEKGVN